MPRIDTKTRILDASEQLFAGRGVSGTSIRAITAKAKVNLAAIHYHFGSKESVLESVLSRRLIPLNAERLTLLEEYERRSKNNVVALPKIIEALVGPALRVSRDPKKGGGLFMKLLGRLVLEPDEKIQSLLTNQFRTVLERFMPALKKALPGLEPADFYWRLHFLVGAMAHTMADSERIQTVSGGICNPDDTEDTIKRLVSFIVAGMEAES
ncbi:MAG: TetR family transcriptional regulator [Verrucomicrobiota bacterium]|jgi:AcrR family transcriptional regulator|nr:TetR family transcriptional regulator [Verrucomicrobiota bacterium]MEE2715493.1 TetR family transcriptional regulator [Verrucomicrobiota bacterium]